MITKEEFPPNQTYTECSHCGKYAVKEYLVLISHRNNDARPDGWTRFLPWNWLGPIEYDAYKTRECANCNNTVSVEPRDVD